MLLAFAPLAALSVSAQTIPANPQRGLQPTPFGTATPQPSPNASPAPPSPQASPTSSVSPQPSPTPSLEKQFFKNILRDEKAILTSPFHLTRGDARYLAPIGIATIAFLATDQRTTNELVENGGSPTRLRISRDISYLGSAYATGGVAAAFYLIGRKTHDARARETGLLAAEALIDGQITVGAIKIVAERQRPSEENGYGEFLDGGGSFPSGHAVSAWSVATVIASEYRDKPLVKYGVYGLAAAVSVSRYTGRNHFLSDVLIGSAIGYGIGRYVYKTHHDSTIDQNNPQTKPSHHRLFPFIAPSYNPRQRLYAARLTWSL